MTSSTDKKKSAEIEKVHRISNNLNEYQFDDLNNDENFQKKIENRNQKGLFANSIWENIRENIDSKLDNFDLQKELQNIDYYSKLSSIKKKNNLVDQDKKIAKVINQVDMSKIMKARVYRDELELMFRSSKMNEMRTNTLPDYNLLIDNENISVLKYLPLENNKNIISREKSHSYHNINSTPKNNNKNQTENIKLFSKSIDNRISGEEKKKLQLQFLEEIPFHNFLNFNGEFKRNSQLSSCKSKLNQSNENSKIKENILNNTCIFPPLTIDALMEYKPLIKAPGKGEFENGQTKLFKLI